MLQMVEPAGPNALHDAFRRIKQLEEEKAFEQPNTTPHLRKAQAAPLQRLPQPQPQPQCNLTRGGGPRCKS